MGPQPGTYRIRNYESDIYFDLSREQQGLIHAWHKRNQDNQLWFVRPSGGNNRYVLQNVESRQYAHADGIHNGSELRGSDNPTPWDLQHRNDNRYDNVYFIAVPDTEFVVDLDGRKQEDGAKIHLWKKTEEVQRRWHFERINDNSGEGQPPYQPQQPQQPYQQPPQQHSPPQEGVSAGTYVIRNKKTRDVLDVSGGKVDDNTPILGYEFHNSSNQKWRVEPNRDSSVGGMTLLNLGTNTYASFPGQGLAQNSLLATSSSYGQAYHITAAHPGFYISPVGVQGAEIVLDLVGHGDSKGRVCLWEKKGQDNDNQRWDFEQQ